MSRYDAWLTTDRLRDEQEAYADYISDEWQKFSEDHGLPFTACEEEHEAYRIYEGWLKLFQMTEEYVARVNESEWEDTYKYSEEHNDS